MVIVVGYVPKPEGRAAVQRAVEEAALRNARLVVVNSSRGDAYVDPRFASTQELETLDSQLENTGVEHEIRQPVRGREAAEEIVAAAEETGAELVVIGMRRRTPVGKLVMGSTAQRVLLDARCPVLAVKASEVDEG
jgi:nucleotide-binding universal stress UspA family protein